MKDFMIKTTIPARADGEEPTVRERLVRARNQAQALKHVVLDTIQVGAATTEDAMRIAAAGGKLEQAKGEGA